jgi:hypothetical protein
MPCVRCSAPGFSKLVIALCVCVCPVSHLSRVHVPVDQEVPKYRQGLGRAVTGIGLRTAERMSAHPSVECAKRSQERLKSRVKASCGEPSTACRLSHQLQGVSKECSFGFTMYQRQESAGGCFV